MTFKLYYHFQQCIGAKPCAAGSFSCFSWHDNSPSHRSGPDILVLFFGVICILTMAYLIYMGLLTEQRLNVANFVSYAHTIAQMERYGAESGFLFCSHAKFRSSCYGYSVFGSCGSEEKITIKLSTII